MAAKATLDGAGAVADDRGKSAFVPPLHPNRITGKCELGSGKGKEKRGRAEPPGGKKWGRRAKGPHFRGGGGGGGGDACGKFRAAVK